ncbi:uncharacterized protein LOC119164633 isoform X1 [Rhipicephalus microplus]|uniref:uncharacterized protein LOC119164633 isoform X1 n=1 Tax=Rhipicephalus microplus TaxID=6941 RepID=UPI003F6AEF92
MFYLVAVGCLLLHSAARWSANYGFYVLSTLHSSEAANFFTELQSHGSSHIPERSTLAAAARPHMEPRMFGSSCSPRHAYVTGAARPQTDPQMLAFMEPTL